VTGFLTYHVLVHLPGTADYTRHVAASTAGIEFDNVKLEATPALHAICCSVRAGCLRRRLHPLLKVSNRRTQVTQTQFAQTF
jgi:hypothetical protein